jgi:hypothetical protein
MKNHQSIICPFCNSKNVAEILYGLPAFSKKLEKELNSGKLTLGGCCISDESPRFHCNSCVKEWKPDKKI